MKMKESTKDMIKVGIAVVLALVSIFVLAGSFASPKFHAGTIETLDEKEKTVMKLTAAATAASAAITLIPDDVGTPIADKLADISGYFLIVLCAVFLEKYLVTVTGYAAFVILIPAACALFSIFVLTKKENLKGIAKKLLVFALALSLVIPISVKVSNLIEATYQESIDQTVEAAVNISDELNEDDGSAGGLLDTLSKIKNGASNAFKKLQTILGNFIEAVAVMLVTSCVIPVLVLLFFVWLLRSLLGAVGTGKKS